MQYRLHCCKLFCEYVCVCMCVYHCGSAQQRYLVAYIPPKSKKTTNNVLILNLIKPYKSYPAQAEFSSSFWNTSTFSKAFSAAQILDIQASLSTLTPSQQLTSLTFRSKHTWLLLTFSLTTNLAQHPVPVTLKPLWVPKALINSLILTLTQAHQYITSTELAVDWEGYIISVYLKLKPQTPKPSAQPP